MSQTKAQLIAGTSSQDVTFANAAVSSLNGGPLAGTRNRIINGNFDIWQRGTSTTTTGNTYLADRWASAFASGGTVSQETSSLPSGSRFAWKFVASTSNTFMQMGQAIEFNNCHDFQNTTVSISFMARAVNSNAGSTALTVRTRTIAGVDGTCLFAGANSDTSVTLTTTWTRYTVTRTLPATFGSLSLEFVLGSHINGDGIMLAQVQLEAGTTATPFERRSFDQEVAACQRYYFKTFGLTTAPAKGLSGFLLPAVSGSFTGNRYFAYQYPVPMRATPTILYFHPSGSGPDNTVIVYTDNSFTGQPSQNLTPTLDINNGLGIAGYVQPGSVGTALVVGNFTASAEL